MDKPKPIWKSKTLWFNILMTAILCVELLQDIPGVNPSIITVIVGIGNVVLRVWFTTQTIQPVGFGKK